MATSASADTLSFYGTPGTIDMPNAYVMNDGEVALTSAGFGQTLRNTFAFQITPRLTGTFRYSYIGGFNTNGSDRYDRSFDVSYQVLRETARRPAVAVGLRDFGGTGIYSGEYVAATKSLGDVTVTGGLGWGRFAGRNAIDAPLALLDERFETRPSASEGGIDTTGQLDFGAWFRGDASPFAGVSWAATDKLTVVAEYSPDLYVRETAAGSDTPRSSPLNFGVQYQFDSGVTLGAYALAGEDFGLSLSYIVDPGKGRVPGTAGPAPRPIYPRSAVANSDPVSALRAGLSAAGLGVENIDISANHARISIVNGTYLTTAQAIGRASRAMANSLPAGVEVLDITMLQFGMPIGTVTINRSDLEDLEFDPDNAWKGLTRARFADSGPASRSDELPDLYPGFGVTLSPYFTPSLFDPQRPLRYETGLRLNGFYSPAPGFVVQGEIRQPLYSTITGNRRGSNSVVERVRSDSLLYFQDTDLDLTNLTATAFQRPAENLFSRVTVGYLERAYGGVSAEVLWYPINSPLAVGAELNYALERDFDGGFGFQEYKTLTGHVSAYYDIGNGFLAQVDAGRYLAGDWGATIGLDREFDNGVRIGAFFTLTDMPFEDFGEGSFDKGIRVSVPVNWLGGPPTQRRIGRTIRPVVRDGGARVFSPNRLYGLTRSTRGTEATDNWGLFWR